MIEPSLRESTGHNDLRLEKARSCFLLKFVFHEMLQQLWFMCLIMQTLCVTMSARAGLRSLQSWLVSEIASVSGHLWPTVFLVAVRQTDYIVSPR